ncbi:protein adenylyltransferase SelO [Candidatus Sulfurimonas baltica]|uniref:Protein nucleotidyltransferase YdiU n=1 Tax=Candidatus Sulfurimonas baltica TaxID=2740404 RepID=A0A7S7RMT5_9BACT|nr:YdiU family protein [Candidatus Sulfurimonas baltica]QOY51720.1 YdiU family protein [Candidatus Sulfurimonas baltica]
MKLSQLKLTTPYMSLDSIFFDEVEPTPLKNPFLISASQDAAKLLGIEDDISVDENLVNIVNGSHKLDGSKTFSMCYAGHQFGYFVPRLGDGRAINLGKVNGQNLQLKGAGLTLYSRQGDGRAVLRSSIREYLMSEAMHGLGIETSRALALIGSDTDVARERWEKGAIVLRLSPTWVRFGTFEYFNSRGEHSQLQKLADYVIDESFFYLKGEEGVYLKMYGEIVKNTAKTVAKWQSVGFNHGVMNTDNMSIDGRTIDYGPFAFLDDYDANYVCNHTDVDGRYSFKNQPGIAHWNLQQLAVALSAIVNHESSLEVLESFGEVYEREYLAIMYKKMGLFNSFESDLELLKWMLGALGSSPTDYTKFFRLLSRYDGEKQGILELAQLQSPISEWLDAYDKRLKKESLSNKDRHKEMLQVNPKYILKNHILQEAIEKAQRHDFSMIEELLTVAQSPFEEHFELEHLSRSAPQQAKNLKLSCSS